jgi:hypothetical protein
MKEKPKPFVWEMLEQSLESYISRAEIHIHTYHTRADTSTQHCSYIQMRLIGYKLIKKKIDEKDKSSKSIDTCTMSMTY